MDMREKGPVVVQHCENCGGDGGWLSDVAIGRWDCCPCCDGTGDVEVPRVLITLDDMFKVFGC